MGLFDKFKNFKESRKQSRIEKATKLVKNAKAMREDRWAAISYFAEDLDDANIAVPALLQRFEYSLEHGINDTREKELALKGVVRFEQDALPHLVEHLTKTTRIAWPIKAIKQVSDEKKTVDCLKSALNFKDVTFDQSSVDKNYDILCYLAEHDLSGYYQEIAHFLNDPDERVRYAATEALVAQAVPEVAVHLEPLLLDSSVENRRLHQTIVSAFVENAWPVSQAIDLEQGPLGEHLEFSADRRIKLIHS